ncbi:MAG: flagellar assembly protein FliW [Desulfobacteraceae bacterium]|nr:flagellar assembly protein FliW [Desulfobacteraceae bacterium]
MKILTRQFGEIEIDESKIINVPAGIPGFQDRKRYSMLQKEEAAPFLFFQSVDDPNLSFVILDPSSVIPDYLVEEKDIRRVVSWDFDNDEINLFVIVTIPNEVPENATANFLAPLVINTKRKEGLQLILQNSTYSCQHPLVN